ncbi:MAG: restriction endonuclease subunit S [bacterium]|nr:restriction endonuclease subunit S [bacterium]
MKLETFFEKFDQFADAPNAVAKMRELLIHLAVDGKLVPNNPAEKPVGLKLSGTSDDDSSLPANWRSGFFGDAFSLEYGDNLPAPTRSGSGEYPVYGSNGIVGTHNAYLTREPAIIVGRKGSAGALNIATGPSWTTDVAYFVRPPSDLDLRFTYYLLSSLRLDELGKGIKPGLSRKETYALPIALPPLAEQKRIVGKVDELIALCDRLEAQQQERETRHAALARASLARFADAPTPANLHHLFYPAYTISPADLRKSILTLAVRGKLVPQDPNDEPADSLLERVQAAKEAVILERIIRRSDEVEYSEPDDLIEALPGWVWVHVHDVAIVQGGKRLPNGAVFSEAPTPHVYIRVTDMKNGTISQTGLRYISQEVQREIARYIINKEDLYITIAGTIGDVGFVPDALDGQNLTENAAKIVFRGFEKRFFQLALASDFVRAQFIDKTKQMAQPKLALKRIAGAKFCLPPLAEQRRIVAKVDQLMALVNQLETQLTASRATAANLLEALVTELTA